MTHHHVALLIADIQKDIANTFGEKEPFERMIGNTRRLIDWARAAGVPVIYSLIAFRPDYLDATPAHRALLQQYNILVEGTAGTEVVDELEPKQGDFVMYRRRVSAFYNTELELVLRSVGADTLVITGCATNRVVESTARDAANRDLRVIVVSDATAPSRPEFQEPSLRAIAEFFGEVATSDEVMKEFG